MSRGSLDKSLLLRIHNDLPDLKELQNIILGFSVDFVSIAFPPESSIPVATVCLQDATHTLAEARYALHECLAHKIWYEEEVEPRDDLASVFFGRFYIDDTALRLFSANEHFINAIMFMLELESKQLKKYKQSRDSSRLSLIERFLLSEQPHHPLIKTIAKLTKSQEWQDTIEYRNRWVHTQPPTIKGFGMVYERRKRWKKDSKSYILTAGGGDTPEYSIDDLIGFVQPALFNFTDTLLSASKYYVELLNLHGIRSAKTD